MQYHLNIAGENSGPHSQFTIIERIRDGLVPQDALIWRQGFDRWLPAGEVEDFEGYWPKKSSDDEAEFEKEIDIEAEAALEPMLGKEPTEISLQPRPWVRFWARVLDYLFFVGLVFFFMALLWPSGSVEWLKWVVQRHLPLDTLLMLSYVPVEAWFLSRFGKTPGRMLLRLEVEREHDGGRLTFKQALVRSVQVYVKGMALWLPFVSLLTMSFARLHLMRHGRTSWDMDCGTVVTSRPLQGWRMVVLGAVALMFLLLLGMGIALRPELMEVMNQPK